jgi:hypothetical protein
MPEAERIIMPTAFPSAIKIKNYRQVQVNPQQLSTLDISIYDLCDGNNYPAYYGGTVTGSISTEYVILQQCNGGLRGQLHLGRRFCSKVVSEFEGDAKLWWELHSGRREATELLEERGL